ncbi:MAG: hypothetical protein HQL16_05285 [Candidatus Omnitrophica bacterium]|nr:hypothetical protein [Candidatus Omnitrophota bacterium]
MMPVKKTVLFVIGFTLVIAGITLAIKDWIFIQMMFRAVVGPMLAVLGLVLLAIARD